MFYSSRFLLVFVYLHKSLFQDGFSLHSPVLTHIIIRLVLDISENITCWLEIFFTLIFVFMGLESPLKPVNKQTVSHNYGLLICVKTK